LNPLIFDPRAHPLYQALGNEITAAGGVYYPVDGSAAAFEAVLGQLPGGVTPQIVVGGPLSESRSFEDLSAPDLIAFTTETLLATWTTLQTLCQLRYREGASIVVLQPVAARQVESRSGLERAALFATRAMIKAAVLDTRGQTPPLRFNLLLVPAEHAPVAEVLAALEGIALSSFLTGTELSVHGPRPRTSTAARP
jgi:hypothetical protein